jgi:hypothetical protein
MRQLKWLFVAAYLCLEIVNFIRIDSRSHSASDTLRPFVIQSIVLGVAFWAAFFLVKRRHGKNSPSS